MYFTFKCRGIRQKQDTVVMKTTCTIGGLQAFYEKFRRSVESIDNGTNQKFVPATEAQVEMLKDIAKKRRTTVAQICRDYGVERRWLSKADARTIIGDQLKNK